MEHNNILNNNKFDGISDLQYIKNIFCPLSPIVVSTIDRYLISILISYCPKNLSYRKINIGNLFLIFLKY